MLALVSPAKKLDFESEWHHEATSLPALLDQTEILADVLKKKSQSQLQNLMKLSDKLGALNYARYQAFNMPFTAANARPAVTAFRGDTYVGLDADTLSPKELQYAQKHLGILSGFYGLLRPLDLMQAYRLEMGTRLSNPRGKNLYDFWGDRLAQACNQAVKKHKDKTIISLASNEYIKAIKPKALDGDFITCHFKELKSDGPKTIGLFAKRARGMMARHIIQNKVETAENLKDFSKDGYKFIPALSDGRHYLFLRDRE